MTTRKGWLNDWEDAAEERIMAHAPVTPPPEPANGHVWSYENTATCGGRRWAHTCDHCHVLHGSEIAGRPCSFAPRAPDAATFVFVDDFGGSHCPECGTVYVDDGDGCPTCGEAP
jgi:hypothetical protein